jgi:TctA family transporter
VDLLASIGLGLQAALTPVNLFYCAVGVFVGTLIGVLPGLGPVATIAMLLPATFALPPVSALIMLAGIYYGAQYGGSTTAILSTCPGRPRRSSPRSTATGWRGRAAPAWRWPRRPPARSWRAPWPPS